jgi:HEAT repeats/SEFIR domain
MSGSDKQKRPTAFISYAQSSKTWQHEVLQFATVLRTLGGVDAELDLFHETDHQRWTTFGSRLISDTDFTLIAVDSAYRRRWLGEEETGVGAGAAWEAAAVKALFERDQDEFVKRVKVVVLPSADLNDIPDELRGICERFQIGTLDEQGVEGLLRSLWGKPAYPKPPLGEIPALPPRAIENLQVDSSPTSASLEREMKQVEGALARDDGPSRADDLKRKLTAIEVSLAALSEQEKPREKNGARFSARLQPLVAALDDPDSMVRFNAMAALGDRLDPELLPLVKSLLGDPDAYIRQMAVDYYARLAGPDGSELLVKALDDPDSMVRFNAMAALGDRLSPELLAVVEQRLKDGDAHIRQMAVDYYGQLSDRDATPQLAAALDDPDSMVRFNAMAALGDRLDPELLPLVESLLDDPDAYIRQMAVDYYAQLAGR